MYAFILNAGFSLAWPLNITHLVSPPINACINIKFNKHVTCNLLLNSLLTERWPVKIQTANKMFVACVLLKLKYIFKCTEILVYSCIINHEEKWYSSVSVNYWYHKKISIGATLNNDNKTISTRDSDHPPVVDFNQWALLVFLSFFCKNYTTCLLLFCLL